MSYTRIHRALESIGEPGLLKDFKEENVDDETLELLLQSGGGYSDVRSIFKTKRDWFKFRAAFCKLMTPTYDEASTAMVPSSRNGRRELAVHNGDLVQVLGGVMQFMGEMMERVQRQNIEQLEQLMLRMDQQQSERLERIMERLDEQHAERLEQIMKRVDKKHDGEIQRMTQQIERMDRQYSSAMERMDRQHSREVERMKEQMERSECVIV